MPYRYTNKAYRNTLIVLALVQVAVLVWILSQFFEPPWLTYTNQPFPVEKRLYKPGDAVPITVSRCNTSGESRAYLITVELLSIDHPQKNSRVATAITGEPAEVGCTVYVNRNNYLPLGTSPGHYRFRGQAWIEGRINGRWIEWKSQPFRVTK